MAANLKEPNEPLNLESLYGALEWGTSSDQRKIQLASEHLQAWQTKQEYHRLLQQIVGDQRLSLDTRWLAAIQLKNGIDRFWRKTAVCAISKEEKDIIRAKCISISANEPDHRLALQNALFAAKIVRVDYPQDWPNALHDVLQIVKESISPSAPLHQLSGSLLLLLTMIKELSTARLMRTRRSFFDDGPAILETIITVYVRSFELFQNNIGSGDLQVSWSQTNMKHALICLRIIRRLLASAFENPSRSKEACNCWATLSNHFQCLIATIRERSGSLPIEPTVLLENMALQLAKMHCTMIELHPTSFPLLPSAMLITSIHWDLLKEFSGFYGSQPPPGNTPGRESDENGEEVPSFLERISLKGFILLRGCAKMIYNPIPSFKFQSDEDKQEKSSSKIAMKEQLLSQPLVREMMEMIVTRFFVFRPSDLRKWANDPAEWERSEEGEGDSWRFSVRICAEKLFLDLVLNNKDLLIGPLFFVRGLTRLAPQNKDVLLKDSIYSAVGLSAPVLHDKIDFNSFLTSTLVSEIQHRQDEYKIIRRRASIMVGQWSSIGGLDPCVVYQIFEFLLDPSQELNDLVVRITAGRQLKRAFDPYDPSAEKLHPFAGALIGRLMALTEEVQLVETKIALLDTLKTMIQIMEAAISFFANEIVGPLSRIWDNAEDEYLLKQTIMGLLSDLFKSMGANSAQLHPLIIPFIANVLEEDQDARNYLLDDTVDLWASMITQAPESTEELLSLWKYVFPLFETADENFRRALEIIESYVLLSPHIIMQDGASQVWQALTTVMSQPLRRDARVSICGIAERLIMVAQSIGGHEAIEGVITGAEKAGFTAQIICGLLEASSCHQNPSPKAPKTEVNGIVETSYWRIVARIMVGAPKILINLLQHMSGQLNMDRDELLHSLLTELFSHYDSLSGADASKLVSLGLVSLVESGDSNFAHQTAGRLQDLITVWTAAIHECTYEGKDNLVWNDLEALKPPGDESPEQTRRRELEYGDPIRKINILEAVAHAVQEFSFKLGASFDEATHSVDKEVMAEFVALEIFN